MHIYFAILTFSKVYYSIFYFVCELTRTFNSFTPCKWIWQINKKKNATKKPKLITPNRLPKNPLFFIYLFAFKCINSCFKTQSILQWYIIQLSLMLNTFNLCSVLISSQLYTRLYISLWLIVHTGPVVFFLGVNIIIIQAFKHAYFRLKKTICKLAQVLRCIHADNSFAPLLIS